MRDMKIILMTAMLVAGTGAFAQRDREDNNRHKNKDKQKTEVNTERKDSESRHSETRQDSRGRENRELVYSDRDRVRYSERNEHRNDLNSDNHRYDQRNNPKNRERSNDLHKRNDREDRAYVNRGNRNEHGRSYAYGHREHRDEACPLCYQPRLRGGFSIHYSVQDLASMETRRLAMALDLTERQIERIYSINLRYLSRRAGNHYYAMERREREIRKVLRWGQVHDYDIYLRHMDKQELCDDCHVGWGNGKLRIAFNINL